MIGIDLVDLEQAKQDSNWQRKGYLNKIFTSDEQQLIHNHRDPNLMVWILWSMKEAAYKIWSRNADRRIYAPTSLRCENIQHVDAIQGIVAHLDRRYFTKTYLTGDYICTIASLKKTQLINIKVNLSTSAVKYSHLSSNQSRSHHGRYLAIAWL